MTSVKDTCIYNTSFAGLPSMKNARVVFSVCVIGSILTCMIIQLEKSGDGTSWRHIKFFMPQHSENNDTLADLISAGWNCSIISTGNMKDNKFSVFRYDSYKSKNQTNETQFLVPNVVHYVWLGSDLNFTFVHYLSFLSVHRYIVPTYIFVYGESGPTGYWWNRTVHDVDNLVLVYCVAKTHAPNGKLFAYKAHDSDILRTQILFKFGGIYLDTDVIVLKSFDPLRRYRTVMGREESIGLCNGILIGAKGAPFIRMLLEQYESYTGENEVWAHRSVLVPNMLSQVFTSLIHIEETSLQRPNWRELDKIYDKTYDWKDNYAIHLWMRLQARENKTKIPESVKDINCASTTIGEIGRHVYFGSKQQSSQYCSPAAVTNFKT